MNNRAILLIAALIAIAGGAYWFTSQGKQAAKGGEEPAMRTESRGTAEMVVPDGGVSPSETAASSPEVSASSGDPRAMKEALLTLDVEGMTCAACSAAVTHELKKLDGVLSAEADYKTGKATVKYDSARVTDLKAFTAQCAAAIKRAGYKVKG
jgi:copper chaperone CopZ